MENLEEMLAEAREDNEQHEFQVDQLLCEIEALMAINAMYQDSAKKMEVTVRDRDKQIKELINSIY